MLERYAEWLRDREHPVAVERWQTFLFESINRDTTRGRELAWGWSYLIFGWVLYDVMDYSLPTAVLLLLVSTVASFIGWYSSEVEPDQPTLSEFGDEKERRVSG